MTTKGLPGFLRRTLRVDYSEDDGDMANPHKAVATESAASVDSLEPETNLDGRSSPAVSSLQLKREDDVVAENIGRAIGEGSHVDGEGRLRTSSVEDSIAGEEVETNRTARSFSQDSFTASSQMGSEVGSISSLENSQQSSRDFPNRPQISMERKQSYRETQFDKVIKADVVQLSELRKLAWNGIPREHRGMAWKLMLGYVPANQSRREQVIERKRAEYRDTIAQHYDIDADTRSLQEQETLRQVLVDVPRTAPEIPLFRNERIRRSLGRLLYIWAMRHPASSYVQGINDLATPLFAVFLGDFYDGEDVLDGNIMVLLPDEKLEQVEADCYWCLTHILAGIQDHYTADQPGVQRMVMRLEELVNRIDADLCTHLRETGIQFLQFAFKWMNCLLLREFPLRCVIRLWDTYISENGFEDFHVYVCAAFLCQFSGQLQYMEFDELFGFMQNMPTDQWTDMEIEMLLSQSFVLSTLFGGSDAHLTSVAPMM